MTAGTIMGRPKGKRSGRDDVVAKMDRGVIETARKVAALRGVSLAEYLTLVVGPIASRDLAKEVRKIKGEEGES